MPPRRRSNVNEENEVPHYENNDGPPPPPPPYNEGIHPTLAQFMVDTNRHFAEVVDRIPVYDRRNQVGCTLRDFSGQQFRLFDGAQGPLVAEAWITDIQLLFEIMLESFKNIFST